MSLRELTALEGLARFTDDHQPAARSFLESAAGDQHQAVAMAARSLMNKTAAQ